MSDYPILDCLVLPKRMISLGQHDLARPETGAEQPAGQQTTTVRVPTIVDNTDEGADTGMETMSVSISSPENAVLSRDTATGTINDTIPPGINSPGAVEVDKDSTTTFTVELNTQPTHDVAVAVASDDTGIVTVNTSAISFTTTNWNVAQPITAQVVHFCSATRPDFSPPLTPPPAHRRKSRPPEC